MTAASDDALLQVNATKMQRRLHSPVSAADRAADVVEHVLRTGDNEHCVQCRARWLLTGPCAGGEPYLETGEQALTWWQLALLDVYAVLAAAAALVAGAAAFLLWGVLVLLRRLLRLSRGRAGKSKAA